MGHLAAWLPDTLVAATILLWATALLPEYLTALLFFAAAAILHVAPVATIFSGFQSAAFWLVLSGFVLGAAIRKVGLADRMAQILAGYVTGSWPGMVGGVVAASYALAFVMPSNMGRIALLMPTVLALADRAGLPDDSPGRIGLALAVGFATFQLSASILPSNVPNLVMAGAAEAAYGVHFAYLPYLVLHAPVLGILKGATLITCIVVMFPARPVAIAEAREPKPFSGAERRLCALLIVTLGLWMTDGFHGVQPAWVGLAAACLCLLPRVGVITSDDFAAEVNIRTCLYIAGILGLAAVVTQSGMGAAIGKAILPLLPLAPSHPGGNFGILVGLTALLNFAVTANGVPALLTPLAKSLSEASGLSLTTVLMVQVIGYATPLLPYQASPIVVAMGMGRVPVRAATHLCLTVAMLTVCFLLPLDYAWFRWLALIG